MYFRHLQLLQFNLATALMLAASGCHCCSLGLQRGDSDQCESEGIECPTSPHGNIFEEEKANWKIRRDAKKDSRINADGCSPEQERKPLLKRIADKANRESEDNVIKTAAQVKQDEDLCQQKVKAVKYLGKLGCHCYDKDGKVATALLDALNDCSPAVRLTAVQAVGGIVCNQAYPRSCCNEKIAARLAQMAEDTDKQGCPVEPDPRIREWAAYVSVYCPKKGPTEIEKEGGEVEEGAKTTQKRKATDRKVSQSEMKATDSRARRDRRDRQNGVAGSSTKSSKSQESAAWPNTFVPPSPINFDNVNSIAENESNATNGTDEEIVDAREVESLDSSDGTHKLAMRDSDEPFDPFDVGESDLKSEASEATSSNDDRSSLAQANFEANEAEEEDLATSEVVDSPAPSAIRSPSQMTRQSGAQGYGVVQSVNLKNETAQIRLPANCMPVENSRVHIVHKFALGRVQSIGEFEVVSIARGMATIRPIARTSLRMIAVGDSATVF